MKAVKWGEYKITSIFDVRNTHSILSCDVIPDSGNVPYLCASSENNAVSSYISYDDKLIDEGNCIFIGGKTFVVSYQEKDFYSNDSHNLALYLKDSDKRTKSVQVFMASCISSSLCNKYSWGNSISHKKIEDDVVQLPQTADGKIDFDFMESFIRELEEERIRELSAYLTVSGLSDATLTEREKLALQNFDTLEWQEFRMGDLFDRVSTAKLPYKAADLPKEATAENPLPCLTSSFMNQGLNYYAPKENATVLKHVISIPSNSDVYRAYYQSHDFTVLSDAYAIRWNLNDREISAQEYLFMVACINQVTDLPIYSYKNKLGGWNVVQNKYIMLPVRDGVPDYEAMQDFISAVQKLVIQDVVKFTDGKIAATKKVVKKEVEYKLDENKSVLKVAESSDYKSSLH